MCVRFHSCSCLLPFLFMCVQVCVCFHSSSSVFSSIICVQVCVRLQSCLCELNVCSLPFLFMFASILVLVCASVCSLLFLFMCVQVCVCFHSSSSVFSSIICVQVCVRFHSCSSVYKYVFVSILVLMCASVCSLPF